MTSTPPLYARYLAADPERGLPVCWITSTAPFDGARLYELAPTRAESEMKMITISGIGYADSKSILERYEYLIRMGFDNREAELDEFRKYLATLAAANSAQAQRIEELEKFVTKFHDNFETCDTCNGDGIGSPRDEDCFHCQGTGKQILSYGVMFVELPQDSEDLMEKSK